VSDLEDLNDKKMGLALRNPHYQLGVEVPPHTHTHTHAYKHANKAVSTLVLSILTLQGFPVGAGWEGGLVVIFIFIVTFEKKSTSEKIRQTNQHNDLSSKLKPSIALGKMQLLAQMSNKDVDKIRAHRRVRQSELAMTKVTYEGAPVDKVALRYLNLNPKP
jgi:hypothetical protein